MITFLTALFIFISIERPARLALVNLWPAGTTNDPRQLTLFPLGFAKESRTKSLAPLARWGLAGAALTWLVLVAFSIHLIKAAPGVDLLSRGEATRLIENTPSEFQSVTMGDRFILEGFHWKETPNPLELELVWRTVGPQDLDCLTAVHFLDQSGQICAQADQLPPGTKLPADASWRTQITIKTNMLRATHVALGLLKGNQWLLANRGPRDWGGRRLLIPIPAKVNAQLSINSIVPYQGFFEIANTKFMAGWVWKKQEPDQRLQVDIFDGNVPLLLGVPATNSRPDLTTSRIGSGAYGFAVATPPQLKDGREHELHVRVSSAPFELTGSPKKLVEAPQLTSAH